MRIFLTILFLFFAACAGRRGAAVNSARGPMGDDARLADRQQYEDFDEEAVSNARYFYLRGQLALASEDMTNAEIYLTKAAALETAPAPSLRNSLAFMYVREAKYDQALAAVNEGLVQDPTNAELLQTKAAVYAAWKKYDEAIAALKEIKEPPADRLEEYYNFLSTLYIQKGDVAGAQAALSELAAKRPESFIAHYQLGRIYEASGNPARAELEYSKALSLNSDQRGIVVDLARALTSQKKYKEAEAVINRQLAKDPDDPTLRNAKIQLYLVQQRTDAALAELRALAKLEEDSTQTRSRIAIVLIDQKKYTEAVRVLRELLEEKPEQIGLNYYLASALAGAKQFDQAKDALRNIKPGSQLFVESRLMAASISQQQKNPQEGLSFIEEGLQIRPDNTQLLTFKSQLLREQGDREGALAIQQQLIKLEPNEDKHKFLFAVYLDELNRKTDAVVVLRALVQSSPNNSSALNYLGYTLVETEGSNLAEAEQLIKRAIAIEPSNGYYIDSLGWLYFKQQRYVDAERELAQAVKFVPDDAVILEHYVRALIGVGNKLAARSYLVKAKKYAPKSDDKEVGERLAEISKSLTVR